MASKKQKPQGKTPSTPQSDPWEKWWGFVCVDEVDRQAYLDDQTGFVNEIKTFNTRSLRNARGVVSEVADEIDSGTFDAKEHPVEELAELEFKTGEYNTEPFGIFIDKNDPYETWSVSYLLEKRLFKVLKRISVVGALPEAMEKLKDLAPELIYLLMAGRKFFTKKIELANAIGHTAVVEKLENARKEFCMIELTGDIETDAERLFFAKKNMPDTFHAAMRSAFKLDREATDEINGVAIRQQPKRKRLRHIPYKVALAILERLNCPKDRKTLQRWINGQNTPEDFTPECVATVQAFSEWARIYANREQAKINTNNALRIDNPDNRKMGRFK